MLEDMLMTTYKLPAATVRLCNYVLSDFISELSQEEYELLENQYEINLDINNLDFWEKVLHVRLEYD